MYLDLGDGVQPFHLWTIIAIEIFFFLCRTVAVKRYRTQARFMKSEVEMFCREVSPLLTKK